MLSVRSCLSACAGSFCALFNKFVYYFSQVRLASLQILNSFEQLSLLPSEDTGDQVNCFFVTVVYSGCGYLKLLLLQEMSVCEVPRICLQAEQTPATLECVSTS